tara:strand:+ start:4193 stop:4456 length:264 start_codon:yes stop_codon:yes gene_type:complete
MNLLDLKKAIESLSKENQIEIYKMLKENNIPITENKNGSFINISNAPENVIKKLQDYIDYIKTQEDNLNDLEKKKKIIQNNFFSQTN